MSVLYMYSWQLALRCQPRIRGGGEPPRPRPPRGDRSRRGGPILHNRMRVAIRARAGGRRVIFRMRSRRRSTENCAKKTIKREKEKEGGEGNFAPFMTYVVRRCGEEERGRRGISFLYYRDFRNVPTSCPNYFGNKRVSPSKGSGSDVLRDPVCS